MINYENVIKNINMLLADDDEDYLAMTYSFLKQLGYNVEIAKDGKEAIEKLKSNKYQIALLDYYMPGLTGEEVIKEIREYNKELIIILQTGFSGQKPPIETMKSLGIQNYYDKTEGIDKLNLEIISAVKIFNQQSEIELSKFKSNAIGDLIFGIAQEIKSNLLSISAGIEYTNMLATEGLAQKETVDTINKFYNNNKESLEKIDKVLSSIINQSTENSDYVMSDVDVLSNLNVILSSDLKKKGFNLNIKNALKVNSYITGGVNDTIFLLSEIIRQIINTDNMEDKNIEFTLSEDNEYWYFNIMHSCMGKIIGSKGYLYNMVAKTLKNTEIEFFDNKVVIMIKK